MKNTFKRVVAMAALMALATGNLQVAALAADLPDPDGKEANMSKPVKVFIIMGQSNALGFGNVAGDKDGALEHACKTKKLYEYLVDDGGNWNVRKDVRNVRVMCSGNKAAKDYVNDWLTPKGQKFIGVEMGAGNYLGEAIDAPVMILKSCIGNRSLGWDLLPPGSEPYEFDGKMQPGYRGTPEDPKGNGQPVEGKWYAGCQYDGDVAAAKNVLKNLGKYYPGAKDYEVAGFLWWQGDKDFRNSAHSAHYEQNLVQLIKSLRKDFDAPNAKFVIATLGQTKKGAGGTLGQIIDAMFAVDGDSGKHPEFKNNVKTFYSNPVSKGGSSSGHYNHNAETYMNVGEGMGKAMVELLKAGGGVGSSSAVSTPRAGAASGAAGAAVASSAERLWTDSRGNTLRASLVEVKDGKAMLKTSSGQTVGVPLSALSPNDRNFIQGK